MEDLVSKTSEALNARGIRGSMAVYRGGFYWRGVYTDANGKRAQRRVKLDVAANPGQLVTAESRVIELASAISKTGILPSPLPWVAPTVIPTNNNHRNPVTVAAAVAMLEVDFWKGKDRSNSAALRTWQRLEAETRRLPQAATINTDLLIAVAETTKSNSRTRLEACKVFKRLGVLVALAGLERLDEIRTPYEPKERDLPSEPDLIELMNELPTGHKWSWPTWALITYGCRPAEVFSLKPKADGTAEVLTIKRKGMLPKRRTALALPLDERTEPEDKRICLIGRPEEYDSLEAKRLTGSWGKWLVARSDGIQLYDLRHCWAIRSIRRNLNASLAAKTMGHSLDVHHRTYHRWLEQQDVAAVAATLQRGLMQ